MNTHENTFEIMGQEFTHELPDGFGIASAVVLVRIQGIAGDGDMAETYDIIPSSTTTPLEQLGLVKLASTKLDVWLGNSQWGG